MLRQLHVPGAYLSTEGNPLRAVLHMWNLPILLVVPLPFHDSAPVHIDLRKVDEQQDEEREYWQRHGGHQNGPTADRHG